MTKNTNIVLSKLKKNKMPKYNVGYWEFVYLKMNRRKKRRVKIKVHLA